MKKYLFITCGLALMVSAATVLAGCSSDDDNLVTPQKAIVGKWKLTEWPGVNLELYNMKAYYLFKSDYTVEYTNVDDTPDSDYHFVGTYSFQDGWKLTDGEFEGYVSIMNPDLGREILYHCWLRNNTMTLADKDFESYENGIPFICPVRTFERTK